MLIHPLPCVKAFVEALNDALSALKPKARLSWSQRTWLVTVLTGIVVTEVLCWTVFERRSLGRFKASGLRWMFSHAKIGWSWLLQASVWVIVAHYGITAGQLLIDDSDKRRAKVTRRIAGAHKVKDKKSGGYFNGQEMLFLVLVTDRVTLPVDVRFYVPDPKVSAWRKRYQAQKREGIPARERDRRPWPNPKYPSKAELAIAMLKAFTQAFTAVKVRCVIADALYGSGSFMDQASAVTAGAQVISELRANQLVVCRGKALSLARYFARQPGVTTLLSIRGQEPRPVVMLAARLYVKAHRKKRFVVALRYAGEEHYRFLVASDLSWRHIDIARAYSLRWLVEVFIQDWKAHGGWNRLTKHQGEEGSTRGVILSLLCDHLLLLHPEHAARLKNKQPGLPVGCMIERLKMDALVGTVTDIVTADDPQAALEAFVQLISEIMPNRPSRKHLAGLELGRLEPTPALRYRAAA